MDYKTNKTEKNPQQIYSNLVLSLDEQSVIESLEEYDSLDDLYQQIELCWCIFDQDALLENLQTLFNVCQTDSFALSNSFFEHQVHSSLFELLEGEFMMLLKTVSISILHCLFKRYVFHVNFFEQFIYHVKSIILNWECEYIQKTLECILLMLNKNKKANEILFRFINVLFFINKLDSFDTSIKNDVNNQEINDYNFKQDDKIKIIEILRYHPVSFDYLCFILEGSGDLRFSIFLLYLIEDNSLLEMFALPVFSDKLKATLYNSNDEFVLNTCLLFANVLCNVFNGDIDFTIIDLIFPLIKHNFCKIAALSLNNLSNFISFGLKNAEYCFNQNIIEMINKAISIDSQNQVKREAVRCLCQLIIILPRAASEKLMTNSIFELLLNVLEYHENDVTLLILKALIKLLNSNNEESDYQNNYLLFVIRDDHQLFEDLFDEVDEQISLLVHSLLELI
ncbi:hypothetical protein TRFO_20401 [Tritrichomonas foetus]|uniref:Uncharacterized protein n=1 Tax=Tritrichomonas foetus TaxID=1144522 RepID=A0A1J4KGK8_9EUKA|nr:hypothetical protein TRFO_20401 [Tritrichomonas foetus]|eukprot:OHT10355.1 hypothetical protein TRFO_20401 [Tritrichomonas foetus]